MQQPSRIARRWLQFKSLKWLQGNKCQRQPHQIEPSPGPWNDRLLNSVNQSRTASKPISFEGIVTSLTDPTWRKRAANPNLPWEWALRKALRPPEQRKRSFRPGAHADLAGTHLKMHVNSNDQRHTMPRQSCWQRTIFTWFAASGAWHKARTFLRNKTFHRNYL